MYDAGGASDDEEEGSKAVDLRYDMDSQRDYTYEAPTAVEDDEDIDSDAAFDSAGAKQELKIGFNWNGIVHTHDLRTRAHSYKFSTIHSFELVTNIMAFLL